MITTGISNHMSSNVWDENTYPFPNVNGATVEVFEWITNFTSHIIMDVIAYPCRDESKRGLWGFLCTQKLSHIVTLCFVVVIVILKWSISLLSFPVTHRHCGKHIVDQIFHKFQDALVPYTTMLHSEEKCAYFCTEWSIVVYGTGAFWTLRTRSIAFVPLELPGNKNMVNIYLKPPRTLNIKTTLYHGLYTIT